MNNFIESHLYSYKCKIFTYLVATTFSAGFIITGALPCTAVVWIVLWIGGQVFLYVYMEVCT